jgi:K(+)-stimulated pyrophosphate-energized sodium pump
LIKVMNLVSLLILPAVISLRNNNGARFGIAAAALVVLVVSILFSKRSGATLSAPDATPGSDTPMHAPAAASAGE